MREPGLLVKRLGLVAVFVLIPLVTDAEEFEISTDERLKVRVETTSDPQKGEGRIGVSGNVGAFGFDNAGERDSSGDMRFTNPPMYGAFTTGGGPCAWGDRGCEYEEIYGPRVANATIGSGGITEGIDRFGRISVLGWPGPGMYDHVSYLSVTRGYPNQGAPANAGSFGGIVTPEGRASWLHPDFGWRIRSQAYPAGDTETIETVLENGELGLEVTITDVVHPTKDLVARNFRFSSMTGPVSLSFAYYANMNPTTARVPRIPSVTDAVLDGVSDFATVYDRRSSTMLHFRPYKIDPASSTLLATSQPQYTDIPAILEGAFGTGVYIAVGGQDRAGEFQAGAEAGGLIRNEGEGSALADPYYDLAADGALSGSAAAFGKTAGALGELAPDPDGSFTIYISAADSPRDAIDLIHEARHSGFAAIRAASEQDWRDWIGRARLPAGEPSTVEVARRALMLIRTAQDRRTGAILANVTTQTPYRQDWVRDGSFFNYALLLAGYPEMAIHHSEFYRRVYRIGGTWDSFYYPDGAEAGFVFPFEIDSQAFALWALWLPYELRDVIPFPVRGFESAGAYLDSMYPAIRDTADALMLCSDPTNGMQCAAAEDDALTPSQGAQGAATVYLALRSAARAADTKGDPANQEKWNARASELQQAVLADSGVCGEERCQGGRGGVYLVWPSRLLEPITDLAQSHLEQYVTELDARASFQRPAAGGSFQYPMEPLLALAPFWNLNDSSRGLRLGGWVRWLTQDVVEPGVLHYAERIFRCAGEAPCEEGNEYLHTIGFPHIWSGAEMYIAAAFVHGVSNCPAGRAKIGEAACP